MDYERFFYDRQTAARGLDAGALRQQLARQARWYRKRLGRFLPPKRDAACLDLPCGAGNFLFFLDAEGYSNVHGFDLDSHQVELARELKLPAAEADAFEILKDQESEYQLISSLDFIEHVSKESALEFLSLCRERLAPGGVLILRTPCADGPFGSHDRYNDITHQWGLSSGLVEVLLKMLGFERVTVLDERPMPTGMVDLIRWLVFFPARWMANLCCMALGMRPPRVWTRSMMVVAHKPDAEG